MNKLIPAILLASSTLLAAAPKVVLPELEAQSLETCGTFSFKPIAESSGLVKSRLFPDVLWTHNDSGDIARIFATDMEGNILIPEWYKDEYIGLTIPDAVNIDWEDITTDDQGHLYIAACGNNGNARRDLAIYQIREPNPRAQISTRSFKTFHFAWPDQKAFPPKARNFDCEAIFYAHDKIYALSKHRSDTFTKLYRFDSLDTDKVNIPTLLDRFDIGGQVTAADTTEDGRKLAVLTYNALWVFTTLEYNSDDYFNGMTYWLPLGANSKQCEAVTFIDDDTLIVTNEQRDLFKVPLTQLVPVH